MCHGPPTTQPRQARCLIANLPHITVPNPKLEPLPLLPRTYLKGQGPSTAHEGTKPYTLEALEGWTHCPLDLGPAYQIGSSTTHKSAKPYYTLEG